MAGQGKGNFGDPEEHKKAGHLGGEATAEEHQDDDFYEKIGHKGGEAAQQSGHAHELTEEERSKGGAMSGGNFKNRPHEDVEEAARKGGQS